MVLSALGAGMPAYQWREGDGEVEMVTASYDSLRDDELVVRGASHVPARYLTFEGNDLTLEVEISAETVLGQVIPAQVATVSLVTPEGDAGSLDTDDLGAFGLPRPTAPRIRLTCTTATANLSTNWISI